MAAIAVIQDRCDCIALLHTFLHLIVRSDAATH